MCIYIYIHIYIYMCTSVLPSISIDGDRLAASTLCRICRSFVLSCPLIVLLHCRSIAVAEVLSCLVTLIVLLHCCSSWPWTGGVGQLLNVKLALDRQFWAPMNVKLGLDRRFWVSLNIKLALDHQNPAGLGHPGRAVANGRSGRAEGRDPSVSEPLDGFENLWMVLWPWRLFKLRQVAGLSQVWPHLTGNI